MKIKLKLFAMLADRLPPGAEDHTLDLEVADGATPLQVIEQMRIPRELAHLMLVNGTHLTPHEVEHQVLKEGETLSVFPPIAGG